MERNTLNQELVRYYFDYDHDTGNLIWKNPRAKWIKVGDVVGHFSNGYQRTHIRGIGGLLVHRLVFLFHHGYLPNLIDHVDQDSSNNKVENLRESDKIGNVYNTGLFSHNKSGFRGVSWCKNGKKWTARFKHNGKYEFLGYFELKEDAYEARLKREKEVFG